MNIIKPPHKVKASKQYICNYCGKIIYHGEEYESSTYRGDDGVYNWRTCSRCERYAQEAYNKLWLPDGLTEGKFQEYMYDNYENIAKEWWENEHDKRTD